MSACRSKDARQAWSEADGPAARSRSPEGGRRGPNRSPLGYWPKNRCCIAAGPDQKRPIWRFRSARSDRDRRRARFGNELQADGIEFSRTAGVFIVSAWLLSLPTIASGVAFGRKNAFQVYGSEPCSMARSGSAAERELVKTGLALTVHRRSALGSRDDVAEIIDPALARSAWQVSSRDTERGPISGPVTEFISAHPRWMATRFRGGELHLAGIRLDVGDELLHRTDRQILAHHEQRRSRNADADEILSNRRPAS